MKFKKMFGVAALTLVFLLTNTSCVQNPEPKDMSNQSIIQEQNIIPLQFKDVVIENTISEINKNKIQEILKQHNVGDNKFIIFIHVEDKDDLHSGVIINNKIYDFGKVSMLSDINNTELYSIEELDLYGRHLVKIQGIRGANYASTNYYFIYYNMPQIFLHSEGYTQETDLDNDNVQEIVALIPCGVISEVDIYKYFNEKLTVSNLNNALNAITVIIEQDGKIFEAYFKDLPNQPKQYEYSQEKLIEIK